MVLLLLRHGRRGFAIGDDDDELGAGRCGDEGEAAFS